MGGSFVIFVEWHERFPMSADAVVMPMVSGHHLNSIMSIFWTQVQDLQSQDSFWYERGLVIKLQRWPD